MRPEPVDAERPTVQEQDVEGEAEPRGVAQDSLPRDGILDRALRREAATVNTTIIAAISRAAARVRKPTMSMRPATISTHGRTMAMGLTTASGRI